MNLCGREEDRVLAFGRVGRLAVARARVHLHVDIRCGRREVPERQRTVTMQQPGDGVGVADDPRDVARRAERSDLQRAVGVLQQLGVELGLVDLAVRILVNRHDIRNRLPPGELVAVVLEWSDEHHGPLTCGNLRAEPVREIELTRDAQPENSHELVDRRR